MEWKPEKYLDDLESIVRRGQLKGANFIDALDAIECLRSWLTRQPSPEAEAEVRDFRADELDAVMASVDKWFDEDDPRLKQTPCNRAGDAREIALQAIEAAESRIAELEAEVERLKALPIEMIDSIIEAARKGPVMISQLQNILYDHGYTVKGE